MTETTIGSLAETLHAAARQQTLAFEIIHQCILDAYRLGRKDEQIEQKRQARLLAFVAQDHGRTP